MCTCWVGAGGGVSGVLPLKKNENQECRRSHIRSFFKALTVSNLPELCLFAAISEEKVPIYFFFLLNVFEHKIEMIMSWQYLMPTWIWASDCDSLRENTFWNLKTGCLQVGISNSKLGKVICSRDVEAVLIQGFYEQTMLSLHKKIESNWKWYANMKVPVKVLRLLPWRKPHLHILSFYKYRASEASEKKKNKKKKKKHQKNNSNILCLLKKEEVGLIVKFYKSLSQ